MASKCHRCLLYQMDDGSLAQSVYDYIDSLSQDIRTPQGEYTSRLALCMACDQLVNGMCRLCGCFVEVRAAKHQNSCSQRNPKW